ncbi:probable ATP-dependent RNA helicase DDX43 isoform X2 [Dermacentor silvarum]|uniref:probable ATP-dependent RNA helicase DDX43 isoform X1 n=1 Tax=Dermacentor silvarum TaxID=543639 RepID=UPI002100C1F6|nr:probable ATP-dependent RNA helicase DDX43 isoform X1 [Dermacentor silvarum]XP_049517455.1 probable ATP-dependent RNA helicase DDX43 isoform X2 [Dermacentor silvarum]
MDAASKNADYEWIEDEYVPPPSQQTSEPRRCGEGDNLGALSGRGRGRGNYERPNASRTYAEVISVPVKDVARIIGRGGSRIRELEDSSGARIWVKRDDADYFETKIELSGSEEARRKACELIDAIVHPPEEPACSNKSEEPPPLLDWDKLLARSDEEAKKRWASLAPIVKNFYVEDPEVASMSADAAASFRATNNNIVVKYLGPEQQQRPDVATNPVTTFEQAFSNYPEILDEIYKNKFAKPSPIQSQAWPILLQGQDLIGIAQTGTGKTLAFLLPALIHIDSQPVPREERKGPSCLILAPTRELAQQIEREANKYHYRGIKCVCIYGGGSRREQIQTVNLGVEIVIATPGRLNDLVMNRIIDLNFVTFLVLDEADRMLDMGFEIQIRKVMLDIRPDRQTVMTSATWPEGVRRLSQQYMTNPFQVFVGSLDLAAVHTVTQTVILCEEEEKREQLLAFFNSMQPEDKVIVFVDRKAMVDHLTSDFVLAGINCDSIHGSREQCDRERALEDLRDGRVRILIATDVAARGLDIKDVTHIFNYDFPHNVEEYVHRVGRTGRAGRTGTAITLITRGNWRQARELISILEEASQEVPTELYAMADRFDAWKERRAEEERSFGMDRGGRRGGFRRGGGGGGNRNRW